MRARPVTPPQSSLSQPMASTTGETTMSQTLAPALTTSSHLEQGTKEGWAIYFFKVRALHAKLENADFGIRFGLFLHYEMKLPLAKLQLVVEAACKEYAAIAPAPVGRERPSERVGWPACLVTLPSFEGP